MANQPFAGVRVLDQTQVLAGPFTGRLLGDLGADVIKIEQPPTGESSRGFAPYFLGGESAYFLGLNGNKRAITLNLKFPEALEIFYKLVKVSDVVLENFRPSVPPKLKIDYDTLKKFNPRIIYCAISGFGNNAPNRERPAMDTNIQAMSGVMSVTGYGGQPPASAAFPIGDLAGAYSSLAGIATALFDREKTGEGRFVDISLLDTMVSLSGYIGQYSLVSGKPCGRLGAGHPTNVPVGAFQTKDGSYVQVQCVTQPLFKALVTLIAEMEPKFASLTTDERFDTPTNRLKNRDALMEILKKVFITRPADEWITKMSSEIAITKVNTVEEALREPSLLARNMVVEVNHPKAGKYKIIGNPIKVGQDEIHRPAPLLGQHNEEILCSLCDYTPNGVKALKNKGAI
jgi:CoA:oxalate CoA-transferase